MSVSIILICASKRTKEDRKYRSNSWWCVWETSIHFACVHQMVELRMLIFISNQVDACHMFACESIRKSNPIEKHFSVEKVIFLVLSCIAQIKYKEIIKLTNKNKQTYINNFFCYRVLLLLSIYAGGRQFSSFQTASLLSFGLITPFLWGYRMVIIMPISIRKP